MNNEMNNINEAAEQSSAVPETPEVFAEQLIEPTAEEIIEDDAADEAIALALAAEEDSESAQAAEKVACECCESAEIAEEVVEEDEEPTVAVVFDEDEEFVPPITFSDDYDEPVDERDDDYYSSNAARVRIHLTEEAEKKSAEPAVVKKATLGQKIGNFIYHNKVALLIAVGIAALVAVGLAARFMA